MDEVLGSNLAAVIDTLKDSGSVRTKLLLYERSLPNVVSIAAEVRKPFRCGVCDSGRRIHRAGHHSTDQPTRAFAQTDDEIL